MSNSIQTIKPEITTLEAEGVALAKMWKSICSAEKTRFNKSTQADGFDTRLGKLMLALKQEANGRISSQRLKDCGINGIDKRRRSEALWFVENETEARAFVKASKKGFTSLSALQKAMAKSAKADDTDTKDTTPKGEDKSDVGLADDKPTANTVPMTAGDIALEALIQCETNGVAIADFMLALKEQLAMLDKQVA